jgi:hypothetical protein
MTFNPRATLQTLDGLATLGPLGRPGEPLDVGRNRVSVIEDGRGPTTPRPISPAARARLLAELPFESVPVPVPGAPTPVERTEALLRALAQITSTDRTASAWLLRGRELRLQTPGSVTLGRPNPATSPASTAVRVRFD